MPRHRLRAPGPWLALVVVAACGDGASVLAGDTAAGDAAAGDALAGGDAGCLGPCGDSGGDQFQPLEGTDASRALGFKLFYREQVERGLVAFNRYGIVGDSIAGSHVGGCQVARAGQHYDVACGPSDNNDYGRNTREALAIVRTLGGRPAELTLLRQLNGLTFLEEVTGHPGLTVREALPGWTRVMDGLAGTVTRTRRGAPIAPPSSDPALEQEVLASFFAGARFTYHEDPTDFHFSVHPLARLTQYALTFVFAYLEDWLHISNCCSSWVLSKRGPWTGAFWGNHNSRDNWPDIAIGYLAALDAASDPGLPEELRAAARRAAAAGRRIGDRVVEDGFVLTTVATRDGLAFDYDHLIPAGQLRPDGRVESNDLGSLNSCQLGYLAVALSSAGLDYPPPAIVLPMPDNLGDLAFAQLLAAIGLEPDPGGGGGSECRQLNAAMWGRTWGELLTAEIGGVPWIEVLRLAAQANPAFFDNLLSSSLGDFDFLERSALGLCLYAKATGKAELLAATTQALAEMIAVHLLLVDLVTAQGSPAQLEEAAHHAYKAGVLAAQWGIPVERAALGDFSRGMGAVQALQWLYGLGDTSPRPLLSDDQIEEQILAALLEKQADEPQVVARYRARFFEYSVVHKPPLKRSGEAYEVIDAWGAWRPLPNISHIHLGVPKLALELPLCEAAPEILSCAWARLGCGRPDLDDSGGVDGLDRTLFDGSSLAWQQQACWPANGWCDGADLDRDGRVTHSDHAFMDAAAGCMR